MIHNPPCTVCDPNDTQARLLNAAEALFIDAGYAGMSARAIAQTAGVNIAAMAYHFGCKQGLLEAALARRVEPINDATLRRLAEVCDRRADAIEAISQACLWPVSYAENEAPARRLMGRVITEPADVVEPLLDLVFSDVIEQFVEAVAACFPNEDKERIAQKFSFVVGALSFTLLRPSSPLFGSVTTTDVSFERLLKFSVDGFQITPTKHTIEKDIL